MGNTKDVGTMTCNELEQHLYDLETRHRRYMRSLRALLRVRQEEMKIVARGGTDGVHNA